MPLNKRCAVEALGANIGELIGSGRPRNVAAAIGYSTLKRACGVPNDFRGTPKEIVARGRRGRGTVAAHRLDGGAWSDVGRGVYVGPRKLVALVATQRGDAEVLLHRHGRALSDADVECARAHFAPSGGMVVYTGAATASARPVHRLGLVGPITGPIIAVAFVSKAALQRLARKHPTLRRVRRAARS